MCVCLSRQMNARAFVAGWLVGNGFDEVTAEVFRAGSGRKTRVVCDRIIREISDHFDVAIGRLTHAHIIEGLDLFDYDAMVASAFNPAADWYGVDGIDLGDDDSVA